MLILYKGLINNYGHKGGENNLPKVVDYEVRRKEILENASEVFAVKGYEKTKLADISEKCGIGRTTLYQYFKNKEDIFYYTATEAFKQIEEKVESIVEDESLTFLEKLKKLVFELTNECEHNFMFVLLVEVWVILKRENNDRMEKINQYNKDLIDIINKLISDGIEAKELKAVDSESMADILFSFIQTSLIQPSSGNNNDVRDRMKSVNLLIDGLKA